MHPFNLSKGLEQCQLNKWLPLILLELSLHLCRGFFFLFLHKTCFVSVFVFITDLHQRGNSVAVPIREAVFNPSICSRWEILGKSFHGSGLLKH